MVRARTVHVLSLYRNYRNDNVYGKSTKYSFFIKSPSGRLCPNPRAKYLLVFKTSVLLLYQELQQCLARFIASIHVAMSSPVNEQSSRTPRTTRGNNGFVRNSVNNCSTGEEVYNYIVYFISLYLLYRYV